MINLIPKEATKQIKAGHNNVFLIKALLIVGISTAFLALVSAGSYIFLVNVESSAKNSSTSSAIDSNYQKAKKEADAINLSITNSQNILSQKISYSKIILELGKILPKDMIIPSLSIDENAIGQQITLKIYAESNANAELLKTNFNSSAIFTNYNVTSTADNQTDIPGFPTTITISVSINRGAAQ